MNTSEAPTILLALNILILLLSGFALCITGAMLYVILERTAHITSLGYRLESIEDLLRENIGSSDNSSTSDGSQQVFRSMDGKYTANTLEELIKKMAEDPSSGIVLDGPDGMQKFLDELKSDDEDDDEDKPWSPKSN